jgi:phospholipase C
MLENRSFDHMLAYSGLQGTEIPANANKEYDCNGEPVPPTHMGKISGNGGVDPDPDHDFKSVMFQMYGKHEYNPTANPTMDHFVQSYETACKQSGFSDSMSRSHNIMNCQPPDHVPVLIQLASQFAYCTRWFSSLPGPTLPNRLFAHFGTSFGRLDQSAIEIPTHQCSIYEVLDQYQISSTIYAGGWSTLATVPGLNKYPDRYFGTLDDFYNDSANNDLPGYCFIEPRYGSEVMDGVFRPQNDQHPDSDLTAGEELIFSVYDAILSRKEVWETSLLIITYDEHGGIYDHVCPPPAIAPGDDSNPDFDFKRYGVRVPAIIVSAYTPKVMIDDVCDHTSIIACARRLLTGEYQDNKLGARARSAYPLDKAIGSKREDIRPLTFQRRTSELKKPRRMNHLQREHVKAAAMAETQLPKHRRIGIKVTDGMTDQQAQHYVSRVYEELRKGTGK